MLEPAILYLFFSYFKPVNLKQKNRIKIILNVNLNCIWWQKVKFLFYICYFETKNSIKTAQKDVDIL